MTIRDWLKKLKATVESLVSTEDPKDNHGNLSNVSEQKAEKSRSFYWNFSQTFHTDRISSSEESLR